MKSGFVDFQVSGGYALFSDPLTRVGGQKCSYPVPTAGALLGMASSIYVKPTLSWYIDRLRVMNPIRMFSKGIRPIHYQDDKNDLAYYTYLVDVCYQVRMHFEWNENYPEYAADRNEVKHLAIARDAIERGGRRPVFLGTSECVASVEPCEFGSGEGFYDEAGLKAFGPMVYGLTYPETAYSEETKDMLTLGMWFPEMRNGVIDFIRPEECPLVKPIRPMKKFVFVRKEVE